jgi:hypothetical protein
VGGIALDCLQGLTTSASVADATMGLGASLLEAGVEAAGFSHGELLCLRKEGLRKECDAARRPGDETWWEVQ